MFQVVVKKVSFSPVRSEFLLQVQLVDFRPVRSSFNSILSSRANNNLYYVTLIRSEVYSSIPNIPQRVRNSPDCHRVSSRSRNCPGNAVRIDCNQSSATSCRSAVRTQRVGDSGPVGFSGKCKPHIATSVPRRTACDLDTETVARIEQNVWFSARSDVSGVELRPIEVNSRSKNSLRYSDGRWARTTHTRDINVEHVVE